MPKLASGGMVVSPPTRTSARRSMVRLAMVATLVLALLGGLAGQEARAQEVTQKVVPHITCGDLAPTFDGTDGPYYGAWLGYTSTYDADLELPAPSRYNYFAPGLPNLGQPSVFSPGRHDYAVFVVLNTAILSDLNWLTNEQGRVKINPSSGAPSCGAMQGQGPAAPETVTSPASSLGSTGATLNAVVDPNGADTTYRFEYATDTDYDPNATDPYGPNDPTREVSVAASEGAQLASATLDGLQPGTTYHYRVVATNSVGTTNGEDRTFTTPEQPTPNVDVSLSQTASPQRAALGQKISYALSATNNGAATATGVRVVAPLPEGAGFVSDESSPGCAESAGVVTCGAGALDGGRSASFDVVLAPSMPGVLVNGAAVAADQPDPNPLNNSATARATLVAPPQATTSPAGDLTPTTATLNALVDPNGEDATYRFEYAEEVDYDADQPNPYALGETAAEEAISGGEARTVDHGLTGLRPGATYHYRVVATNSFGVTASGADRTFTTPSEPPPTNVAPTIQVITPTPGSEISDRDPTVRAKVADSGTDLLKSNIRLLVDGKKVDGFSYDRATDRVSYEAPKLDRGRHTVLIVARDEHALSSSRFWAFRVLRR